MGANGSTLRANFNPWRKVMHIHQRADGLLRKRHSKFGIKLLERNPTLGCVFYLSSLVWLSVGLIDQLIIQSQRLETHHHLHWSGFQRIKIKVLSDLTCSSCPDFNLETLVLHFLIWTLHIYNAAWKLDSMLLVLDCWVLQSSDICLRSTSRYYNLEISPLDVL